MTERRQTFCYLVPKRDTLNSGSEHEELIEFGLVYERYHLCSIAIIVSDNVTDVVMSSLKTCNMNCRSLWEGRGRVGSKGWAVNHQPGTSVDGHSRHDHQKRDFQVSKKGGSLH
jgi:hypothetical protein